MFPRSKKGLESLHISKAVHSINGDCVNINLAVLKCRSLWSCRESDAAEMQEMRGGSLCHSGRCGSPCCSAGQASSLPGDRSRILGSTQARPPWPKATPGPTAGRLHWEHVASTALLLFVWDRRACCRCCTVLLLK